MIQSNQILDTVDMIQKENLDVRAVTLGLDLLDCRGASVHETCRRIQAKIRRFGAGLVPACHDLAEKYGVPVINSGSPSPFHHFFLPTTLTHSHPNFAIHPARCISLTKQNIYSIIDADA